MSRVAALFLSGFLALSAHAGLITVTSYSTPNGDGKASGGSHNYWDLNYTGSGQTNVDGAPLSGGTGDLTDGIVASDFWYNVENDTGTGPYVGWYQTPTPNPVITFNFAGGPTIDTIQIHIDNSQFGGVFAPAAILVDGTSEAFTAPAPGTIGWITLSGLNLTGNSHTIEFDQHSGQWVFVSEVQFSGAAGTATPEPGTLGLFAAAGGIMLGQIRRRRTLRP